MSNYLEQRFKEKLYGKAYEPKKQYSIPKKSKKKIEQEAKDKEARGENDTDLQRWFKNQMKYMNVCEETGMKLETKIYRYAIMSICHILPKAKVKSVATHPLNRVFLLPDLHAKFDSQSWEEREKWSCWPIIVERLISVYPDLAEEEKRHFPDSVLKYIENNSNF